MRHVMDATPFPVVLRDVLPKMELLANDVEPFIRESFVLQVPALADYLFDKVGGLSEMEK